MRGNGYSVDRGELVYWDLEKCQQEGGALKCFGNNPDSPYGINSFLNENAVDGEYTKDLDINIERRFRADEAIVFFGLTPPEAKYIGYTHYLSKRRFGRSKRINASLGDTINHLNINVTGDGSPGDTFNSDVCIVTTADQNMFDAIATGMLSVGVPSDSMNLQVLAKDTLQLGLTKHHDSISWLNRIVRFADKEAGAAYMANPPVFLFRITPLTEKEIAPYPIPIRKTRKTGQNENYMWYTIERLERTLRKRFDRKVRTSYINPSSKVTATFGETCLKKEKNCKRDNSDAAYFFNYPARNMGPNELLIIYGVNHVQTGFATYMSISIYDWNGVAFAALNSEDDMVGSASQFIPYMEHVDKAFAIVMARDCTEFTYCLEVPYTRPGFPSWVTPVLTVRNILHPNTTAGPDFEEIISTKVMYAKLQRKLPSLKVNATGANDGDFKL
eukprot:CAMPEP_0194399770 /NCGR_PEP_ID=MMETSP0174-20130528/126839_1 /TAXON_ID=216777 /ORGANISM="Proboscia alata, Strain PI-D3" /LENGTH=443 /DNA_ID=CAMNT_0039196205 /DNA_START=168 /DNA_END=1499 /DNA_ORIENTATION=+